MHEIEKQEDHKNHIRETLKSVFRVCVSHLTCWGSLSDARVMIKKYTLLGKDSPVTPKKIGKSRYRKFMDRWILHI